MPHSGTEILTLPGSIELYGCGALYFVSLLSQDCIAECKLTLIQLHTSLIKLYNLLASLNYCILPVLFLFCLCLYSHEEQVLAVCCAFGDERQWWDSALESSVIFA